MIRSLLIAVVGLVLAVAAASCADAAGDDDCCKVCSTGKACGDSCISRDNTSSSGWRSAHFQGGLGIGARQCSRMDSEAYGKELPRASASNGPASHGRLVLPLLNQAGAGRRCLRASCSRPFIPHEGEC